MAKVISNQQKIIAEPWWVKVRIIYIGLGVGLCWWLITLLLQQYVVDPLACRDVSTASFCVNSQGISGGISAVLSAVLGTFLLVRFAQPRPIIISVATAILLWELAVLTDGLSWWMTLLGAIGLYAMSYLLFSMIARTRWLFLALIVALVAVLAIRITLML